MNKTIYDLDLHESMLVYDNGADYQTEWRVTRVASGWIYQDNNPRLTVSIAFFIPFDNKFDK